MSYTIAIAIPSIAAADVEAWQQVDELIDRLHAGHADPAPALVALHRELTGRYPCICDLADDEDDGVWSDGPLIHNFGAECAVLGISCLRAQEVVPFVVQAATARGMVVFDFGARRIHRPGEDRRAGVSEWTPRSRARAASGSGTEGPAPLLSPLHAAGAWLAILVVAVANGALREAVLIPRFGVPVGTTASGLILVVAVAGVAWALLRWRRPRSTAQTWRVGAGWLAATVVFECVFGRFVQQETWPEILAPCAFDNGNLWPLVLLAVFGAPFLLRPRTPHRDGTAPPRERG